jgi:hypothetical protein
VAWTTVPYCQLSDVKLALGTNDTTVDDVWLQQLIGDAQAAVDSFVGYPFQTDGTSGSPATRLYDGSGYGTLAIDDCLTLTQVLETTYYPQVSSQGLWVLGQPTTMDITADCVLSPNNVSPATLLRRLSQYEFAEGVQNYVVKGVFGFATIPQDVSRAALRLTIHYAKMRDANYSDQVSQNQFGKGLKFVPEMPDDVCELLSRHKHRLMFAR